MAFPWGRWPTGLDVRKRLTALGCQISQRKWVDRSGAEHAVTIIEGHQSPPVTFTADLEADDAMVPPSEIRRIARLLRLDPADFYP